MRAVIAANRHRRKVAPSVSSLKIQTKSTMARRIWLLNNDATAQTARRAVVDRLIATANAASRAAVSVRTAASVGNPLASLLKSASAVAITATTRASASRSTTTLAAT